MHVGKYDICIAWDGYFRLDGGAMFGVVPKPLWSTTDQPDDRNRILLSLNPLLVRWDKEVFIVDTGIGGKMDDKQSEILNLDRTNNLVKSLGELGVAKEAVTGVILTHLHFDHAGGSTERDGGEAKPVFPNATYYIQQGEWHFASNTNERTRASYLEENFKPLRDQKQVQFVRGDEQIVRGISVRVTGGHTPYHQCVVVASEGRKVCYFGDLIPTASHLKIPYVMGYDTHPMDTISCKKEILDEALRDRWLVVFPHSPRLRAGYLERTDRGIALQPVDLNT